MTIPSTSRKAGPLLGTGAQTAWPFTFKVFAESDIAVAIATSLGVETALVLNTDYSVTLNANQETSPGGTVTYPISGTPLPVGSKLSIIGNLAYDQPLDLPSGGNFSPLALENELDRLTMQIQQVKETAGRALLVPVTSTASSALPAPEANKLIAWNETASALQNLSVSEIASVVAYGTATSDIFTGTGAQTTFALTYNPGALNNLDVSIGGVTQLPGVDYTWSSGTTVTFTTAPPFGAKVLIRYMQALALGTADAGSVQYTPAGTGAVPTTAQTKLREFVSVKDFGASTLADAVTNTAAFIAALAAHDYVEWPEGVYDVNETITIGDGKTVFSKNAHLNYTNTVDDQACIVMGDNSRLLGEVAITMPDMDVGVDVNHLRVGGGRAYTDGAVNVRIGKVTVYGGHGTMAAVLVEGASSDVHIEEVNCPGTNDKIGQVFGCHWGNFNQHYLSGGGYVHTPGANPTTHPRSVRLDRLIVGRLTYNDGIENCAAFISSSRDVSIGYLYVEEASYAAVIYPGDISFEYADAATSAEKMYGIEIETCIGKTRRGGLYITGSAPYSSTSGEVEFKSKYVNLQPTTTTGNAYPGISMDKVIGVDIDDCRLKYYDQGIGLGVLSRNVRINTPRIESVDKQGIVIAGTLGNECFNVTIIAPFISNCNRDASTDPAVGSAISLSRAQGVTIVGGILGAFGADTQYAALNAASTVAGVSVENVKTYGSVSGVGFYANAAPTDQVSFVNCSCASGMTLRSGGTAVMMIDQRKVVFGLAAPTSGTWEAGDVVFNRGPSLAGLPAAWHCLAGGTPGTWEVMAQTGVRTFVGGTPAFVGQIGIAGGIAYIAVGTSSAADWKQIS